jgi:hypothetical protein
MSWMMTSRKRSRSSDPTEERKIRLYSIDSLMMYQWVDSLNIDTPRGVRKTVSREKVVLYDSDEELSLSGSTGGALIMSAGWSA